MSENTTSTSSQARPLTAAERQDIYNGAIGSLKNTYTQSGLPYDGSGSMYYGAAQFDGSNNTSGTGKANVSANSFGSLYNASGNSSNNFGKGGQVTLDPKTYFQAENPNVNMPTGSKDAGGINFPTYVAPDYQNPGSYSSLGDYGKLQEILTKGNLAGLDYAKENDMRKVNDNAAKRGVWSSGLVMQDEKDLSNAYAPSYAKAGADATSQRYNLELSDLNAKNNYNLNAAKSANDFNTAQQGQKYTAGWAPLNYLANTWNGTTGQVSGSNSFGQGISI